jgi:hypothetical protein
MQGATIQEQELHKVTPCNRVWFEKLTAAQLLNKFPAIIGTPIPITIFTRKPLVLFVTERPFPSGFLIKIVYAFLIHHMRALWHAHLVRD